MLLDPRWQKARLHVLERDAWTCQICGRNDRTLHVHHAAYDPNGDPSPWETPPSLLFTACADCHGPEHQQHRQALFGVLMVLADAGIVTSLDLDAFMSLGVDEMMRAGGGRDGLIRAIDKFAAHKSERIAAGTWFEPPVVF
jgi:hypothetical protein